MNSKVAKKLWIGTKVIMVGSPCMGIGIVRDITLNRLRVGIEWPGEGICWLSVSKMEHIEIYIPPTP